MRDFQQLNREDDDDWYIYMTDEKIGDDVVEW
jgi:hypothetical protein